MHALDGLGPQLGEEARHVLLVLFFLSGQYLGRLPLDGFNTLMLVSTLLSLYHAGGFAGSLAVGTEAVLAVPLAARRRRPYNWEKTSKK